MPENTRPYQFTIIERYRKDPAFRISLFNEVKTALQLSSTLEDRQVALDVLDIIIEAESVKQTD